MTCGARLYAARAPRMGGHMSRIPCAAFLFAIGGLYGGFPAAAQSIPNLYPFPNENGFLATYNIPNTPIDLTGPFFQSLGTNGRSCASCHLPDQGWSIAAAKVKARFEATQGMDPIFRTNDGSNCDHSIDTSTLS